MLNSLTVKKNIKSFSVSPENPTSEKGKGGMAKEGSASHAARELGQGWKVNPFIVSQPGEISVLADVKGQGAIKHFWITDSARAGRLLILRIYFDGHKNAYVQDLGSLNGTYVIGEAESRSKPHCPIKLEQGLLLRLGDEFYEISIE